MGRWFRSRASDERGAVLVVVAIAMVVMIGSTALAVDIGRVTVNNRDLQATADVIALDAVRALGGGLPAVAAAAQASAERNGFPPEQVTVKIGTKSGSSPFVETAVTPNAVQVTTHRSVKFAFAPGSGDSSRSAVAVQSKSAGFSIGSWLASGSSQGILGSLLGSTFNLKAVSYDGLANANIPLELLGANIPAGVLTPSELLQTSVSIGDFMAASIAALTAQGQTAAVNVLQSMIQATTTVGSIKLGDIVQVEPGGETAAATAGLNVLQLLQAGAMVAQKNSGHALSIPTAGLSLPAGLGGLTVKVTVVEPPKIYFGPAGGPSISSAQVRLEINSSLNLSLTVLGTGLSIKGDLPIELNVAGATASLSDIDCSNKKITVKSKTQAVTTNTNISLAVKAHLLLVTLPVAELTLSGGGLEPGSAEVPTTFQYPGDFGPTKAKSVAAGLGLGSLLDFNDANIKVLGVLSLGQITDLLLPPLNAILSGLDSGLVTPLTNALGLKIGGADIAALGMSCSGLRLAE